MSKRKEPSNFNVWRSYSDMMAGLLMLFVLIMCVTLFQAQKNYDEKIAEQEERIAMQVQYTNELDEKNLTVEEQQQLLQTQEERLNAQQKKLDEQTAKLAEQQKQLDEQTAKLAEQQATLNEQTAKLAEQQATLHTQEEELSAQQNALQEKEDQLAAQSTTLEEQEKQLTAQSTTLKEQEKQLTDQQTQLAEQKSALDEQTAKVKEKQEQLDKIIGVKADVIEALRNEFTSHNINVDIDAQTGALLLDANVMFDRNDSTLLPDGESVLSEVLPIYCQVLLGEEYRDNVSEIIIDGYTDTDGEYEYNLELSQKRSLGVAQYLLSIAGQFLNSSEIGLLQEKLTVNGHSMSNPILNDDGSVNKDASRRVEVKFRLKDEEMISEMSKIVSEE